MKPGRRTLAHRVRHTYTIYTVPFMEIHQFLFCTEIPAAVYRPALPEALYSAAMLPIF